MVAGNGLFYPIIGFASFLVLIYWSFGDLWVNYRNGPELSFVQRNGTHFMVDGRVFYVNGWNSYWLMDHAVDHYTRPRVREMLRAGAKMGLTVCRTWAFNDGAYNALQISPGRYDERVFRALDHVIAEARKHGIRLLLSLVNNLLPYGGKTQYVKWAWEEGVGLSSSNDSFFYDPSIRNYFKNHVKALLTRRNTITGIQYRDDPTIFAWELINEPRCISDPSGNTLQDWIEEMSVFVKSIDKKHLLTIGLEGFYGPKSPKRLTVNPGEWAANLGSDFIRNSKISTIDFATVHIYPDQWFPEQELDEKLKYVSKWMVSHIEDGDKELRKPIMFTEFGLSNLSKGFQPSQRERFYKIAYDVIYESAQKNDSGAGSFVWQFLVGGMEEYNDDYGIVPWESPSMYRLITQHSCRLAISQGVLPSQKEHLKELCLQRR
ncbi:mannan endo-1,4-beta-mannosidase 2-like [Rhododendron vialii]|uniref:mannan endo-1,4-beta-mannosidase 2-like n=1 Tax=Rhododendron vialii TaxID=182163 RepID=UPI0026604803|nr:mannan endo-1,4-beta-mannosidase 2-like [Rhododendron vialii]